jgi:hypothetical protein
LLIDERHHHFARRSSSASAKKADAFRKNLVRAFQFEVLTLEAFQLRAFVGG